MLSITTISVLAILIIRHNTYTLRSVFVCVCVRWLPRLHVRGHTLQQRQGVTHSVGLMSRQRSGVNRGVDVHDFLLRISKLITMPQRDEQLGTEM